MSREYPDPEPKRVRHAEWDYVAAQARKGAVCKWCKGWHLASDGRAESGDCPGVYVRHRNVAIIVLGIPNTRAGQLGQARQAPGKRDVQRCLAAAIQDKNG